MEGFSLVSRSRSSVKVKCQGHVFQNSLTLAKRDGAFILHFVLNLFFCTKIKVSCQGHISRSLFPKDGRNGTISVSPTHLV